VEQPPARVVGRDAEAAIAAARTSAA
jgi:hypothetical protein